MGAVQASEKKSELVHDRVDDIPVLLALAVRLRLPQILEKHLKTHGNQQGLGNGWLCTVWLVYILSEGDHRKCPVEQWVEQHTECLRSLVGTELSSKDFNDDRLGVVLGRLSRAEVWEELESELWACSVALYELKVEAVRLDSTTSYGYHEEDSGFLMRRGHSKDHRPDLPQLKLMAAAAQPCGQLMASRVQEGSAADDPLYTPLIEQVRTLFGVARGLLYVGDSKMASLAIRAEIARHADRYLMPLPLTGNTGQQLEGWIDAVVLGEQNALLLWDEGELIGAGYELSTQRSTIVGGRKVRWKERLLIVRSSELARAQAGRLEERLFKAIEQLLALTPPPARGRQQIRSEEAVHEAIDSVLKRNKVEGLLKVSWQRHQREQQRLVGPGRNGPNRPVRQEVLLRYQITAIARDEPAIALSKWRMGWRVYATNAPPKRLPLEQAVRQYRAGWSLERDFHLVKDLPLGLSPLYVRKDDQIRGMTHLLTLGLRMLTLIELQVRQGLAKAGEKLAGLYEGNPARETDQPTATRLLKAIARAQITLIRVDLRGERISHLTPLSPLLLRILSLLDLGNPYEPLLHNSS